MSSRRQRSIPLGGRYRQVSLYSENTLGIVGNAGKMCPLSEQKLGQQLSNHFPEGNLQVSDQPMLVVFWEILGHWEILRHVKTCHPPASCYCDKYELRNPCYWDTGTNGDFEILCY